MSVNWEGPGHKIHNTGQDTEYKIQARIQYTGPGYIIQASTQDTEYRPGFRIYNTGQDTVYRARIHNTGRSVLKLFLGNFQSIGPLG